jgi:uroporphyrin-III C-methyltransferase / precorrin-2 dehydrogenase / sirohydrochlorin ferrochelatase
MTCEQAGQRPMAGRAPEQQPPPRIGELATLPLFHKLAGRRVVLAGGTDGALWKAELLAATKAKVQVFAPGETARFAALAASLSDGQIDLIDRRWQANDLAGAALAIADAADDCEARLFADAAHLAGAPVNVIDRPEFCDFSFGAIVNRSPLLVAISTDGAAPVFGQAIRARIEAALPTGLKAWAMAARDWRPAVQARALPFAVRRKVWERFTAMALAGASRPPTETHRDSFLDHLAGVEPAVPTGRVTLVGAGPGDPELLTLKAVRALQSADVILYDDLVSAEVLELARREASRMLVGKTGHGPSCRQGAIDALLVKLARQGRHVVRLKSGDPMVFGRATEELQSCHAAGIPVEIVPGITAAQGAAAALGVSLTERKRARRVQFVTGHGADGRLPEDMAWADVADPATTTVVYMPRSTLRAFRDGALLAGIDPATPAVAIICATRPQERRIFGTIMTLPDLVATLSPDGPMLVMIGAVFEGVLAEAEMPGQRLREDARAA